MPKPYVISPLRLTIAGIGLLIGGVILAFNGAKEYLLPDLPDASTLRDVRLQVPLRIYTRDGRLMQQFGEQRRIPLQYDAFPKQLINALIAAEDDRFFEHGGLDYLGLLRALIVDIRSGESNQGGSTITMLVAKNYFLTNEKKLRRKLLQSFLALRIEEEFSKEEILALFLNKVELGHRAFGFGAAAEVYFGKTVDQLTLPEMALIAGLPNAPSRDNPITSPELATQRRAYVLRRMHEKKYIDDAQYAAALLTPVESKFHGPVTEVDAPNLAEMVRVDLEKRIGPQVYGDGYRVITTIDSRMQQAAIAAVRTGLIDFDQRHGYRGPVARPVFEPNAAEVDWSNALDDYPELGGLQPALILAVDATGATAFTRSNGRVRLSLAGMKWARPALPDGAVGKQVDKTSEVVAVNDVVYIAQDVSGAWRLMQTPQIQGAFVAIDPHDGAIAALVGGFDYSASNFNRAVQAKRQPGSSFKPFLYSAALENGFTPSSIVNDAPYIAKDAYLEGEWRPQNSNRTFLGPIRLRYALLRSRNPVASRLMEAIGTARATEHMMHFGFTREEVPENLSLALGTTQLSPYEMAAAYSVFANGGYRIEPYFIERIEDPTGAVVFSAHPKVACSDCTLTGNFVNDKDKAPAVISPQNVFLMTDMMADVIASPQGTGWRAQALGRHDLAGKTGTSQDYRDTWFCGFNADLVGVAWVGFDQEKPLGRGEEGGKTAEPIWIDFMREALAGRPEHRLPQPPGIVELRISKTTGKAPRAGDTDTMFEKYMADHLPESAPTDVSEREPNRETEKSDEPLF
ncbi:MAG TPA: penicillin-binding protein 1A [Steroidobacteraceae bacterium]|nr:penicillin-binding protein 1A [Steroidobacteraceae bacterium]